jgi:vacuolar-type H+-ATPase subunit C/Vma6
MPAVTAMKSFELDQKRSEMMEALYQKSGRTCSTYTGLWEEFCRDVAANFRDTSYPDLLNRAVKAMDATESVMTQKQAQQAIEVCRQQLLRDKWR